MTELSTPKASTAKTVRKTTIKNRRLGLRIELDASEIYADDPGQGTPCMVIKTDERGREVDSGTYACAIGEGELSYNSTPLDADEMEWLEEMEATIESFLITR